MKVFKDYSDFIEFLKKKHVLVTTYVDDLPNYRNADFLVESSDVSGAYGGSCYNTDDDGAVEYDNPSPDYDKFHRLVNLIFDENERFDKYDEIEKLVVKENYNETAYYGNYRYTEYLILNLQDYYSKVADIKVIRREKLKEIGL